MDFHVILLKRSWIRNAEIRKEENTEGEEVWKPIEIPGVCRALSCRKRTESLRICCGRVQLSNCKFGGHEPKPDIVWRL